MKMVHVKKEVYVRAKNDAEKGFSILKEIQEAVVVDTICIFLIALTLILKVAGMVPFSAEALWTGLLFFIGNILRNVWIVRGSG